MKALPLILGGVVVVGGVVLMASKAKASASSSSSGSTTPKPTATKPTTPTTPTTPASAVASIGTAAQVVAQVLAAGDADMARNQAVWLNDNGYPKTAAALEQWAQGDLTAAQLTAVAAGELTNKPRKPATAGTNQPDSYGTWLLANGTDDEIYTYALTATSIPFVSAAASKLASAGDTRAQALTLHLADLSVSAKVAGGIPLSKT